MNALEKYSELFLESESRKAFELLDQTKLLWSHFCLVPCRKELENLKRLFKSIQSLEQELQQKPLFCFVINAHEKNDSEVLESNRHSIQFLKAQAEEILQNENLIFCQTKTCDYLIIHCSKSGFFFPEDKGVGLARKIGADLGFELALREKLGCSLIFSTDADAILPPDYFSRFNENHSLNQRSAYHFQFHHQIDELKAPEAAALIFYELSLRYYQAGLSWAGSLFSHFSIGSCLAIDYSAYAKARGFPKLLAGEDFYLLNKLRKLGPIDFEAQSKPVCLPGQKQTEVPFGTARSVQKISSDLLESKAFRLYDPKCFIRLREVLESLEKPKEALETHSRIFEEIGIQEPLTRIVYSKLPKDSKQKQIHEVFDAFYQLKLIHLLTKESFPKLEWNLSLKAAPFKVSLFSRWDELLHQLSKLTKANLDQHTINRIPL